MMINNYKIFLALLFFSYAAFGNDSLDNISFFCKKKNSSISIDISSQSKNKFMLGYKKHYINWQKLSKFGPQKNAVGELLRTGSDVAHVNCGEIQINIESGYLNDNPEGQDGMVSFPVIELHRNNSVIFSKTALAKCYVNDQRTMYFGGCKKNWAQSIQVKKMSSGSISITVHRLFEDGNDKSRLMVEKIIQ